MLRKKFSKLSINLFKLPGLCPKLTENLRKLGSFINYLKKSPNFLNFSAKSMGCSALLEVTQTAWEVLQRSLGVFKEDPQVS